MTHGHRQPRYREAASKARESLLRAGPYDEFLAWWDHHQASISLLKEPSSAASVALSHSELEPVFLGCVSRDTTKRHLLACIEEIERCQRYEKIRRRIASDWKRARTAAGISRDQ